MGAAGQGGGTQGALVGAMVGLFCTPGALVGALREGVCM